MNLRLPLASKSAMRALLPVALTLLAVVGPAAAEEPPADCVDAAASAVQKRYEGVDLKASQDSQKAKGTKKKRK